MGALDDKATNALPGLESAINLRYGAGGGTPGSPTPTAVGGGGPIISNLVADLVTPDGFMVSDMAARPSMREFLVAADLTCVEVYAYPFEPMGLTVAAVLAESHAALHTWPERNYAHFSLVTCGSIELTPSRVKKVLEETWGVEVMRIRLLERYRPLLPRLPDDDGNFTLAA